MLDLTFALPSLIVLFPLMVCIGVLVRAKLGTPVLYKQLRPGMGGRPFTIYKFRTMSDERGQNGKLLLNQQRLSKFGRKLRSTSLDELPELFNVFKGDMSIVGPRPLLMDYLNLYSAQQARRHEVRGGITGLAQIAGRNDLEFEDRFSLDVYYIDNISLISDIRIIFNTFIKVARRESIIVDERELRRRFEKNSQVKAKMETSNEKNQQ